MKNRTRWVVSVVASAAAVSASYAASVMLCGANSFGPPVAVASALALIP